jgi:2',3'-cyclic-nucleotide 2'-phosphodiesterase (5'-nucleotidase family)
MLKNILYFTLFIALIGCTKKVQHFAKFQATNYNIGDKNASEDSTVSKILRPYREELSQKMDLVIGKLDEDMQKERPSSSLTNFVADAVFEQYNEVNNKKLDVFISNYGGIRSNTFAKGDIIVSDIFELMPFENTLVVLECNETVLKRFLDKIAHSGGWPLSKNSSFIIKDSVATSIIINNERLTPRTYRIGLPDYVANGGDGSDLLKNLPRIETNLLIRNLMIDHVKRVKNIAADRTQRIKTER